MTSQVDRMVHGLREAVSDLGRRGAVVGVSGGIDSAVTLALVSRAFEPHQIKAVAMPDRESSIESLRLARLLCGELGIDLLIEDVTEPLEALGCYANRDAAILELFPDYRSGVDQVSIRLIQDLSGTTVPAIYDVAIESPGGDTRSERLPARIYRKIFAASNMKQRVRTLRLYEQAELSWSAVIGTSNFDETYLGFFVKLGDGSWDICPLDHLSKLEVYSLASELGVPTQITERTTTTDTFPNNGQSQTEMFYSLPFEELDVLMDVIRGRISRQAAADTLSWTLSEVRNALINLERRHNSTRWNRMPGISLGD